MVMNTATKSSQQNLNKFYANLFQKAFYYADVYCDTFAQRAACHCEPLEGRGNLFNNEAL
jgi:hypothetical protein